MTSALAPTCAPGTACSVMILAGGTGGHIFPGLAVAKVLQERGAQVTWLGAAHAMETRLIPAHDIPLDTLHVTGVRQKGILNFVSMLGRLGQVMWAARRIIAQRHPHAVVSFGGYAAGPGGMTAVFMGLPLLVHEQNRAPGLTNQILARFAKRILTGFPGSLPNEEVVGNPIRAQIADIPPPNERFRDRRGPVNLLILGGSQGAQVLNLAVPNAVKQLRDCQLRIRHQCGEKRVDETVNAYDNAQVIASIEPFVTHIPDALAWADLVICRAGASTLAEICAVGLCSVLVPFAAAVDDHQTKNAHYLVENGAAVMIKQDAQLAENLAKILPSLITDSQRRKAIAQAARRLARPTSAQRIADIILEEASAQAAKQGKPNKRINAQQPPAQLRLSCLVGTETSAHMNGTTATDKSDARS